MLVVTRKAKIFLLCLIQDILGHTKDASVREQCPLLRVEAIPAVQIAMRAGRLGHDVKSFAEQFLSTHRGWFWCPRSGTQIRYLLPCDPVRIFL
jgi:hypothetical protein